MTQVCVCHTHLRIYPTYSRLCLWYLCRECWLKSVAHKFGLSFSSIISLPQSQIFSLIPYIPGKQCIPWPPFSALISRVWLVRLSCVDADEILLTLKPWHRSGTEGPARRLPRSTGLVNLPQRARQLLGVNWAVAVVVVGAPWTWVNHVAEWFSPETSRGI